MSKDRLKKIEETLGDYHESEDSFEQTDLAISLIQGHMYWLLKQAKKADKLQEQLDAKIMFVNNGKEEDQYVLQEENEKLKRKVKVLKDIISQCRCEECGNELRNASDFSYGILCENCLPVELDY